MFRSIKLLYPLNASEYKHCFIKLLILCTANVIGISCTFLLTCILDSIHRDSLFVLDTTKLLIAYAVWYMWSRNQWNEATAVTDVLIITHICTDMAFHIFIELCNKCRSTDDGQICIPRAFMTFNVDCDSLSHQTKALNGKKHYIDAALEESRDFTRPFVFWTLSNGQNAFE